MRCPKITSLIHRFCVWNTSILRTRIHTQVRISDRASGHVTYTTHCWPRTKETISAITTASQCTRWRSTSGLTVISGLFSNAASLLLSLSLPLCFEAYPKGRNSALSTRLTGVRARALPIRPASRSRLIDNSARRALVSNFDDTVEIVLKFRGERWSPCTRSRARAAAARPCERASSAFIPCARAASRSQVESSRHDARGRHARRKCSLGRKNGVRTDGSE